MAQQGATRIQLCGRLVVELNGRRIEGALPGAKGRLLFARSALEAARCHRSGRGRPGSRTTWPGGRCFRGEARPWLDEWRRRLEDVKLRGLECFAEARLGLGGPALPQAEDCARQLIELAPYRESGHRILMEALEQRGNVAEALLAYERVRVMLRDELGVAPGPALQSAHQRLLAARTMTSA
jgi:DNA-binding SARP family transcriptional activator